MKRSEINDYIRRHLNLTREELSAKCGISRAAVRMREMEMGLRRDPEVQPTKASVLQDFRSFKDKAEHVNVKKRYRLLLSEHGRLQNEYAAALTLKSAQSSYRITPAKDGKVSEATAVVLFSDWHVEETVTKAQTMGLNEYTLDIARKRAEQCFQRALRLTEKERQDASISTLIVALLGDFISGRIHEALLEICSLRPVEAILFAQELVESGLRFLLENSDLKLVVPCHVGNHARITSKVFHSTEQGNSLETAMYHSLRDKFKDEPRVTFIIAGGYHTYLDVYGLTLRFHHGHSVKFFGGIGGLSIPLFKAIHQWNLTKPAAVDCLGHFHSYLPLPRAVVNGSLIGHNAFAVSIKAEYERPQQAFFLVDKKRGKTVHIPILFD